MTRPALTLIQTCPVTAAVLYAPAIVVAVIISGAARVLRKAVGR